MTNTPVRVILPLDLCLWNHGGGVRGQVQASRAWESVSTTKMQIPSRREDRSPGSQLLNSGTHTSPGGCSQPGAHCPKGGRQAPSWGTGLPCRLVLEEGFDHGHARPSLGCPAPGVLPAALRVTPEWPSAPPSAPFLPRPFPAQKHLISRGPRLAQRPAASPPNTPAAHRIPHLNFGKASCPHSLSSRLTPPLPPTPSSSQSAQTPDALPRPASGRTPARPLRTLPPLLGRSAPPAPDAGSPPITLLCLLPQRPAPGADERTSARIRPRGSGPGSPDQAQAQAQSRTPTAPLARGVPGSRGHCVQQGARGSPRTRG